MNITPRAYQLAIFNSIMQKGNTLVVLPTGLGKTLIALMLIREKMEASATRGSPGKCLFMTPTKPLAKQHLLSTLKTLDLGEDVVALVSGEVTPKKRKETYARASVIISTPQTIKNDVEKGIFDPKLVSLAVFDECHKSIGNYAYTKVAESIKDNALIVGLTASPGGKRDRIKEVLGALFITNIEIRTQEDPDVSPYVQKTSVRWIHTELSPTLKLIKLELDEMVSEHAHKLGAMGFPPPLKSKGQFMKMRERILRVNSGIKYAAIVQYSILLNLLHMTELIETQGVSALRNYMEKMDGKESKSAGILRKKTGFLKVKELVNTDEEHPKLKLLIDLMLGEMKGKKAIIFAQYRDQIKRIVEELQKNGIPAKQFVGKKDGVTKKIQEETIAEFREGKFLVMVASSIGEEGLDIPAVDSVIFYEPIPSEIRSIQRRGRAGRFKEGEIIILVTRGTRDEYYHWSSIRREKKMKEIVGGMQRKMSGEKKEGKKGEGKTEVVEPAAQPLNPGQSKISDF
ncbi:MAG: DEAD/DEAH box helicase [Candidatus Micrarchaeia archaeon]